MPWHARGGSEDNLREYVFSFLHLRPGDQSHSGHRVWQQVPLSPELFCQPALPLFLAERQEDSKSLHVSHPLLHASGKQIALEPSIP